MARLIEGVDRRLMSLLPSASGGAGQSEGRQARIDGRALMREVPLGVVEEADAVDEYQLKVADLGVLTSGE